MLLTGWRECFWMKNQAAGSFLKWSGYCFFQLCLRTFCKHHVPKKLAGTLCSWVIGGRTNRVNWWHLLSVRFIQDTKMSKRKDSETRELYIYMMHYKNKLSSFDSWWKRWLWCRFEGCLDGTSQFVMTSLFNLNMSLNKTTMKGQYLEVFSWCYLNNLGDVWCYGTEKLDAISDLL